MSGNIKIRKDENNPEIIISSEEDLAKLNNSL